MASKRAVVELVFEPMKGLGGGLRQEWVSGEGNGIKFSLDTGTGLGNPLMTLCVERKGGKVEYFTADIRPMLRAVLDKVV